MIKRFFSYLIVAFFKMLSHFPFWLLYALADCFYVILYYLVGYRKKVVRENLQNSFPEKSAQELLVIEKEFYKHLADLFVEIVKFRTMSKEEISKRCNYINKEVLEMPEYKGKNFICIQGHYGNWEWITHINTEIEQRILAVYKPLHNEIEDQFMLKVREHFGAMLVPKNNILRVVTRRQKNKELSAVGLISDQIPDVNKMTYWMPFLNQDTAVFLGAEKMAKMFDMPIVFLCTRKIKRGHYEVEAIPVTTNPKEEATYEITHKHVRLTEKMIQESPAYWMWSHRRWKWKREDA